MKTSTNKIVISTVIIMFFMAIGSLNAQTMTITLGSDGGSPGPAIGDAYEISWVMVHFNNGVPDQTWDSSQWDLRYNTTGTPPFPAVESGFSFNGFSPSDQQANYKVLVSIKRRVSGNVVCGGQNFRDI